MQKRCREIVILSIGEYLSENYLYFSISGGLFVINMLVFIMTKSWSLRYLSKVFNRGDVLGLLYFCRLNNFLIFPLRSVTESTDATRLSS